MLGTAAYCPVLFTRVAEIKALGNLPSAAKNRLFPILLCRPWPNAKELKRTFEKIEEALEGRRFALDLDPSRYQVGTGRAASEQFDELFNDDDGYASYYSAVSDVAGAVPVVRVAGGTVRHVSRQIAHLIELERGGILIFRYGSVNNPLATLDRFQNCLDDNFLVVLDGGWSADLLSREAWFSPIIQHLTDLRPETEVVVCGSSFPNTFAKIGTRGVAPVDERYLYDTLVRRHNAANLIYGDWGSTRPPGDPVPMINVPRIDLPSNREWTSIRADRDDGETYVEVAERALADPNWPSELELWGTYMIECTAEDLPVAIRSPGTAAAARINIHLYRQAYFSDPVVPSGDQDEPYEDDI